jgi:hypothetical protein
MSKALKDRRLKKLAQKYRHQNVIYGLFDPRTAMCRYIGQTGGVAQRAKTHCSMRSGTASLHSWFLDLQECGLGPTFHVFGSASAEPYARLIEAFEIGTHWMAGHDLLNGRVELFVERYKKMAPAHMTRQRSEFDHENHVTPWSLSKKTGLSVEDARRWMRGNEHCRRRGDYGSPLWLGYAWNVEEDIDALMLELSKREEASAA